MPSGPAPPVITIPSLELFCLSVSRGTRRLYEQVLYKVHRRSKCTMAVLRSEDVKAEPPRRICRVYPGFGLSRVIPGLLVARG